MNVLLYVAFWFVAITAACYVFWQVLRVVTGLAAAVDPERPLFESERGSTRNWFVQLEGVTERNPDGTRRQDIIDECRIGEPLRLVPEEARSGREPRVRVCRWQGEQIGYLSGGAGAEVTDVMAKGLRIEAALADITRLLRFRPDKAVVAKITAEQLLARRPVRGRLPPAAP